MGQYDWDEEDEDYEEAPKKEPNPLRDARRRGDKLAKELAEAREALQKANDALRDRSVRDTIKAKGLPEKIAGLIPKDLTTEDEVVAWVDNYADVFGVPAPDANGQQADDGQQQADPAFAALQRIQGAQSGGKPFTNDEAQMLAQIAATQDPAALNQLLFGNPNGPQAS